ncbi:MAG: T9SS type A sorting domain-containing protein [Flavobacteriales bacterium]|nr:T9SS type A sorting domain-containing protein [Flavobacteriales bacterium]
MIHYSGNNRKYAANGVVCFLLFFLSLTTNAQNLVPNPSFEIYDTCLQVIGFQTQDQGPQGWFSASITPDFMQSCGPYGAVNGLPLNAFTFQETLDGSNCIGLFTFHQNGQDQQDQQREWAMVELLEPLVVGQTYYASFYANAAFGGNAQYPLIWVCSDNVGMLFTMETKQWLQGNAHPAPLNRSHVRQTTILSDTVDWTLVSGSFVADSAYQYVMLGNFYSNILTDTLQFAPQSDPWFWFPWGYTLIDKVCVSTSPNGCDMAQAINVDEEVVVSLYPNPASDRLVISGAEGSRVSIYDMLGRVVHQGFVTGTPWSLNVSNWARGTYYVGVWKGEVLSSLKFVLID